MVQAEQIAVKEPMGRRLWDRRAYAASVLSGLALLAGGADSGTSSVSSESGLASCARFANIFKYPNHAWIEGCGAYVFYDAGVALRGFLAVGRSSDPLLREARNSAIRYFNYRYVGQANQQIRQRVKNWPAAVNDILELDVDVLCGDASLATGTGRYLTDETVITQSESTGKVLTLENHKKQIVSVQRVPGIVQLFGRSIHIWRATNFANPTENNLPQDCQSP